jgi:hypothetical protein
MTRDELIAKINADPNDADLLQRYIQLYVHIGVRHAWCWIIDNGRRPGFSGDDGYFWYCLFPASSHYLPSEFYQEASEIEPFFATPFEAYETLVAAIVRIGFPDGTPVKEPAVPVRLVRNESGQALERAEPPEPEPKITYVYLDKMSFWEWLHLADFSVVSRVKDQAKKISSYSAIGILGLAIGFLFVLLVGFGVVGILNLISGVNL